MHIYSSIDELKTALSSSRTQKKLIGLVPTMGNLHAGHLRLVEEAKRTCDVVVTSIFVNPLQFGPQEDYESYPRTLDQDKEHLTTVGCDAVFAPSVHEIYGDLNNSSDRAETTVHVPEVSEGFCGASRPGHFDGVATVVSKLFNIVEPHQAFFGLKDYQQYLVIKRLVKDLSFPIEIIGVEIMREANGLAMSSRNNYLTSEQKEQASILYSALTQCEQSIKKGERDFAALESLALTNIKEAGLEPDYFSVCDAENLRPPGQESIEFVILGAASLGNTRLIDNVRFSAT